MQFLRSEFKEENGVKVRWDYYQKDTGHLWIKVLKWCGGCAGYRDILREFDPNESTGN